MHRNPKAPIRSNTKTTSFFPAKQQNRICSFATSHESVNTDVQMYGCTATHTSAEIQIRPLQNLSVRASANPQVLKSSNKPVHQQASSSCRQQKARNNVRALMSIESKCPAARRGIRVTSSHPCCATRSGCVRRPRLRPSGHRWSPGTKGHPGWQTGKADLPC